MKRLKTNLQSGFTLVELAVVLLILAVLFGAGFATMGAYLDNAYQARSLSSLDVTKRALLDYVKVNKHMPCPDTDAPPDGEENRNTTSPVFCAASSGTVPFKDIGLGQGTASDAYGNVFAYGVDQGVTGAAIQNAGNAASYFNAQTNGDLPFFTLKTPPTVVSGPVASSYSVCKKTAAACTGTTPSDIESDSIPAVLVAFNENGGATTLTSCNAETGREAENCDNDLFLLKGVFKDGEYDDQIATISGYEIKQQISFVDLKVNFETGYEGYDFIIRDDVSNANTTNIGTQQDDSIYIDTRDDGTGGNLDISAFGMKGGDDKVHVEGDVTASANADMGDGDDYFYVKGYVYGDVILGKGNDEAQMVSGVAAGGTVLAGDGDDRVTIDGDIAGSVDLGNGNDRIILNGVIAPTGSLDGGSGGSYNDILEVDQTPAEWDATTQQDRISNIDTIIFNDQSTRNP